MENGEVPASIAGPSSNRTYLPCDGRIVSAADGGGYPRLFGVVGQSYALNAEEATTLNANNEFRLPDLRGRVPLGSNTNAAGGGLNQSSGGGTPVNFSSDAKTRSLGATGGSYTLMGHNHINSERPPQGFFGGGVDDAGQLELWSDSQVGYRTTRNNLISYG